MLSTSRSLPTAPQHQRHAWVLLIAASSTAEALGALRMAKGRAKPTWIQALKQRVARRRLKQDQHGPTTVMLLLGWWIRSLAGARGLKIREKSLRRPKLCWIFGAKTATLEQPVVSPFAFEAFLVVSLSRGHHHLQYYDHHVNARNKREHAKTPSFRLSVSVSSAVLVRPRAPAPARDTPDAARGFRMSKEELGKLEDELDDEEMKGARCCGALAGGVRGDAADPQGDGVLLELFLPGRVPQLLPEARGRVQRLRGGQNGGARPRVPGALPRVPGLVREHAGGLLAGRGCFISGSLPRCGGLARDEDGPGRGK
eukprot:scaffold407_cov251-Pinguiococcus_pyrenoidosus.AAC.50